jgi:hypothetical protein
VSPPPSPYLILFLFRGVRFRGVLMTAGGSAQSSRENQVLEAWVLWCFRGVRLRAVRWRGPTACVVGLCLCAVARVCVWLACLLLAACLLLRVVWSGHCTACWAVLRAYRVLYLIIGLICVYVYKYNNYIIII